MRILGLDVETTGLNAQEDRITEIGAVLYQWETGTPLAMLSVLVDPERPLPAEIVKITGITDEMLEEHGILEVDACEQLLKIALTADYVMAHNAEFDRGFVGAMTKRHGSQPWLDKPWLCSLNDIKYPESIKARNLTHLAAEHGFVSPFKHRALFDVLTMLRIASGYSIDEIITRSKEPMVYIQALVSFEEKELAKVRGYGWCGPKKIWWRGFKASDAKIEVAECGFRTTILQGAPE